nr:endodeoxyribonuclease [Gluconobacter sp. DsW_056]
MSRSLNNDMSKTRNKFEDKVDKILGTSYQYEAIKIPYVTTSTYTPDWVHYNADGSKTIIETKGYFRSQDRSKIRAVKKQNPELDIVMVFYDETKTISKSSKTTYRDWALKNGLRVLTVAELEKGLR